MSNTAMFHQKVVVITGAGSGIGRGLALRFAREGALLALSDIDESGLAATMALIPTACKARGYRVNVADRAEVFAHAADVRSEFGTAHAIVNNAGVSIAGTVAQTEVEEYRWLLDINLYGVLHGTKAFLPIMLSQREGWVINISSVFGLFGYPTQSAYCMSKFAVRGLTECLWSELEGTGVHAVSVHPAGVKSNIEKTSRFAAAAGQNERDLVKQLDISMATSADKFADDVLCGLHQGKRRIVAGHRARSAHWMSRIFTDSYPGLLKRFQ